MAIDMVRSQAECMQSRGSGAGVDLCLYAIQTEIREGDPLAPAYSDWGIDFHEPTFSTNARPVWRNLGCGCSFHAFAR